MGAKLAEKQRENETKTGSRRKKRIHSTKDARERNKSGGIRH